MTDTPLYLHIARQLQARLDSGEWPPGSRLPAVRQLAAEHGVNTLTALAAYRHLEEQQRVVARPRSGFLPPCHAMWRKRPCHPARPHRRRAGGCGQPHEQSDPPVGIVHPPAAAHGRGAPQPVSGAGIITAHANAAGRQPELIGAYLPTADQQQLYQQYADWRYGSWIFRRQVLFTQGITEAISLSLHPTRPGECGRKPVYFGLLQTLQTLGLKALEIPCTPMPAVAGGAGIRPAPRCPGEMPGDVTNFQNPPAR
jgi:DNA-binding transcriptional MocR family regulator